MESSLVHIATIAHSTDAKTGLNFKKAVTLFVEDVKIHSKQDVFGQLQDDGSVSLICPSGQNVARAVESVQGAKSHLNPHSIHFMDYN